MTGFRRKTHWEALGKDPPGADVSFRYHRQERPTNAKGGHGDRRDDQNRGGVRTVPFADRCVHPRLGASLNGPARAEDRPLTVLVADSQPMRGSGLKLFLEGEEMGRWTAPRPVKVVGGWSERAPKPSGSLPAYPPKSLWSTGRSGRRPATAARRPGSSWALRMARVGRVVLFGGEEDLMSADMEELRKDSGADAALEAARDAEDLPNAVVGTKTDPAT